MVVLGWTAVRSRASFGPIVSGITDLFIHVIPWLPAGPTSIDFQPTDNPRTIEKLRKDPLMIRYPRFDLAYGLLDLMDDACDSAKRVHVPYMMMHGMGDKIVPSGPVKSTIATLPRREDSKLAFYRNGYHLLMRDKEGPKVAADVAAWIADHEAALPSGADVGRSQPETAALWGSQSTR